MANELEVSFSSGKTIYFQVRSSSGLIWNTSSLVFQAYLTANVLSYSVAATEQGSASGFYTASFPTGITTPGQYNIIAKVQTGGSPAESDSTIAVGDFQWGGAAILPRSDLATSGQVGQFLPMRLFRGQQITNFPFYLVSNVDHVTPLTSGICSGQISRDGGAFGPLQSGAFAEVGKGFFALSAFTSGDLLCNTAAVVFTANGISGGQSDQRPFSFVLQRTSGQG